MEQEYSTYAQIIPINEKTDLSKCEIDKVDWDVEHNGEAYQVIRIKDHIHSVGGKSGENDLYAYPLKEEMSSGNIIQFSGHAVQWGIHFEQNNYIKTKWGETEMRYAGKCWITRNGKKFHEVDGRDYEYALAQAQVDLMWFKEMCPFSVHSRHWRDEIIGRKVWYRGEKGVITRLIEDQGCVIIKPEGMDKFSLPSQYDNDDDREIFGDRATIKSTYMDQNIDWYRKDES